MIKLYNLIMNKICQQIYFLYYNNYSDILLQKKQSLENHIRSTDAFTLRSYKIRVPITENNMILNQAFLVFSIFINFILTAGANLGKNLKK